MQLSNKEKTLLFILAIVAVLVIGVRFVLMPAMAHNKELKVQLVDAQQRKADTDALLQRADTIDAEIEQVVTATGELTKPFFNPVATEYLQRWIMGYSNQCKLNVTALTIGGNTVGSPNGYGVGIASVDYPIATYYNNMVNATAQQGGEQVADGQQVAPPPAQPVDVGGVPADAVVINTIQMKVKAPKNNIITFTDTLSKLNKHIVVDAVALEKFNEENDIETNLIITLYSIHKEDDGTLQSKF